MSNLLFCGDPHGEFQQIIDEVLYAAKPPAAVVLLGDIEAPAPLERVLAPIVGKTRIHWILGNHDTERNRHRNLPDAWSLHGRVVQIPVGDSTVRVAGLSGIFKDRIWHPHLRDGAPRWRSRADWLAAAAPQRKHKGGLALDVLDAIWPEDVETMWDFKADILVCHEAPSCMPHFRIPGLAAGRSLGFKEIDELAEAMGCRMIVHGHHHHAYSAALPNGITVQGVGKAEVWRWAL